MSKDAKLAEHLGALGSNKTEYGFDGPNFKLLEKFENPISSRGGSSRATIDIRCPEFTSLCPKTGQPDFAEIVIAYEPDFWCVESKSLKLYLNGFRNHGSFHESCVETISNDLIDLLDPRHLYVQGQFTPRGGIPFWPSVNYSR
jgi:7-cyano-7-deazaguanine reductase